MFSTTFLLHRALALYTFHRAALLTHWEDMLTRQPSMSSRTERLDLVDNLFASFLVKEKDLITRLKQIDLEMNACIASSSLWYARVLSSIPILAWIIPTPASRLLIKFIKTWGTYEPGWPDPTEM